LGTAAVNDILCDGLRPGRHEWVTTTARPAELGETGIPAAASILAADISANPFADQGRLIAAPWTPG